MLVDKYWNDLLQIMTEDDLRVRKKDMIELERTEIRDFLTTLKLFESRLEKQAEALNKMHNK